MRARGGGHGRQQENRHNDRDSQSGDVSFAGRAWARSSSSRFFDDSVVHGVRPLSGGRIPPHLEAT